MEGEEVVAPKVAQMDYKQAQMEMADVEAVQAGQKIGHLEVLSE